MRPKKRQRTEPTDDGPPTADIDWQKRRCDRIDKLLRRADRAYCGPLYIEADRLLADFGEIRPACYLPNEWINRLVDRLELPADLWRIVGDYSLDDGTADVDRILMSRIFCLYLSGNRNVDATGIVRRFASQYDSDEQSELTDLVAKLFVGQNYDGAACLAAELLRNRPDDGQLQMHLVLSYAFLGRFDDAAAVPQTGSWPSFGWSSFARLITEPAPTEQRFLDLLTDLSTAVPTGPTKFLLHLLGLLLTDYQPPTADRLRYKLAETFDYFGAKNVRRMFADVPRPEPVPAVVDEQPDDDDGTTDDDDATTDDDDNGIINNDDDDDYDI